MTPNGSAWRIHVSTRVSLFRLRVNPEEFRRFEYKKLEIESLRPTGHLSANNRYPCYYVDVKCDGPVYR